MFQLGDEQVLAVEKIIEFINSDEKIFCLQGFAGTGKSTIIKEIVKYLDEKYYNYILCAPTHKAKLVLERFSESEAMTLHKLLSLSPNIEILELDLKDLMFIVRDHNTMFPTNGIIICDEASMVNDYLFELLETKARNFMCKLIFVGDKAQLRPVNSLDHSKVFNVQNSFTLSHIYRQETESGLSAVLPILRTSPIKTFKNHIGTKGSVICHTDAKDFFREAVPYFRKAIKNSDILETKLLAYTNRRVTNFNTKMREILFGTEKEYNKFEFLTGFDNLEYAYSKFWNSMDYIIVDEPEKRDVFIPNFATLPGYILNLYDSSSTYPSEVFILSKEISSDYFTSLSYRIEELRLEAIEAKRIKSSNSSRLWKEYYKMIESFATPIDLYYENRLIRKKSFDYGYALTVHKSQGSSINNVFIDMKDVSLCRDPEEFRQLQYVGVSRTKTNAHILQ